MSAAPAGFVSTPQQAEPGGVATEDKAFDQAMLVHMAERIGAKVTKVSASHALFMTQPKAVADTIGSAAREVAAAKKD